MIKTFKNLIDDVSVRLKISNTTEKVSVGQWINLVYRDFQIRSEWYWRKRQDMFQLIPFYKTGTVAVIKNSRTITGTDTIWTSAMEGRYIQVDGENPFYRIVKVSSNTSLIIDQLYIDDTKTGSSYNIWKRFYNLIQDVDEVLQFYSELDAEPLMAQSFISSFVQGQSSFFQKAGIDTATVSYSTGTVTCSINTQTLTGTGTSWIANIQKGDLVTIGNNTYNVLTVDSDTQIRLVQNLTAAVSDSAYTITRKDLMQIEFNATPTETTNMYYDYLKKTFDMINDNDEPEIPLQYRDVLILGAMDIGLGYLTMEGGELKQQYTESKYENRIRRIKDKVENQGDEPEGFYW